VLPLLPALLPPSNPPMGLALGNRIPIFFFPKVRIQRVKAVVAPPTTNVLVCELPQAGGDGKMGVCHLIATHVVSSDLTSHIPSQEGWGLRFRAGAEAWRGAEFVGMEGPGWEWGWRQPRSWGKGQLGIKPESTSHFSRPQSPSLKTFQGPTHL
jgi:hypothetical protein